MTQAAATPLHDAHAAAYWLRRHVRGALRTDSRQVAAGDGFIAWPGAATDGRRFVSQAFAQGAAACLVERAGMEAWSLQAPAATDPSVAPAALGALAGLKAATGPIAAEYFDHPSQQIDVLAVTGTNGKTSSSWWLAHVLSNLKQTSNAGCAVIGTLGTGIPPHLDYNGLTTPDPVLLQGQLRAFVDQGLAACAIEASSIGIAERRLDGTRIRAAIFTNFTRDHLDYHGTLAAYWQAKAELFDWPGLAIAVVNTDDAQGLQLADTLRTRAGLQLWTVGLDPAAQPRLLARAVRYEAHAGAQGLSFEVVEGTHCHTLHTALIGQYNVSNLLGVIACARALGHDLAAVVAACAGLRAVPGRMQCLGGAGAPLAVVDYAHTPDALDQALQALQPLASARGGVLWCVFGCGGDRDTGKRPVMGAIAARHAQQVVVTSDNPRGEKPEAIISQILVGMGHERADADRVAVEPLRERAITWALQQAAAQDVVLVAGKGHEDYQEIAGQRLPFSDVEQVRAALALREVQA